MDDITSFEQLEKRVEWLDNERRNDKTNLASLQNRLTGLESENISLRKQIKDLELELSGLVRMFVVVLAVEVAALAGNYL